MIKELISLADSLDGKGLYSEADMVDEIIQKYSSKKSCYPKDYKQAKKYGRDILAKIFCCIADDENFPEDIVKEAYFPLLSNQEDNLIDPQNIEVGKDKFIDMEEFVKREKERTPYGWKKKIIAISEKDLDQYTKSFITKKESAPGYKKRISYQKKAIMKKGTLDITKDELIILEQHKDKYRIQEGWHRVLAILELVKEGKLSNPKIHCAIAKIK